MSREIPESDWKVFRDLRNVALERFCERVLAKIGRLSSDSSKTFHTRYLDVYRFIDGRDADLGQAFNDPRRSRLIPQLAAICSHSLLESDELARFTPATRESVLALLEIMKPTARTRNERPRT